MSHQGTTKQEKRKGKREREREREAGEWPKWDYEREVPKSIPRKITLQDLNLKKFKIMDFFYRHFFILSLVKLYNDIEKYTNL